eukprot:Em0015g237a
MSLIEPRGKLKALRVKMADTFITYSSQIYESLSPEKVVWSLPDHDPHLLLWQHIQHARGHIRCLSAPEQVQHRRWPGEGVGWLYCLAHLFTYRVLSNGLLGLNNIASPSATTTGGICSTSFFSSSSGTRIIYNTALSSYTSSSNPLVFVEEVLVTGHEIGHSWGSYHDPATTPSCSNVFIMNQYAQDGSQPTHKMFSNCSRTSIGAVLSAKAQNCFTVRGTGVWIMW